MDWRFLTIIPVPFLLWLWLELVRNEALPIPLPRDTIRKMLRLAGASKNDTVYDLGSGDGRALVIASREFQARAVGIEKNRLMVWLSRWIIRKNELQNKIKVIHGDILKENFKDADVILIYLSRKLTQKLKSRFEKLGDARIVSASHPIMGWKERKKIKTGHFYSYLYKI